jgi:hypothetical protein
MKRLSDAEVQMQLDAMLDSPGDAALGLSASDAARSALRSEADMRGVLVRFGPKTDNRLIMTVEQGSQTEREPRVAGTR